MHLSHLVTLACFRSKTEHPNRHTQSSRSLRPLVVSGWWNTAVTCYRATHRVQTNLVSFPHNGRFKQPPKTSGYKRCLQSRASTWTALWNLGFLGAFKASTASPEIFVPHQPRFLNIKKSDSRLKSRLLFIWIMFQQHLLWAMDFYISKTMKPNGVPLKEWKIDGGIDLVSKLFK